MNAIKKKLFSARFNGEAKVRASLPFLESSLVVIQLRERNEDSEPQIGYDEA